MFFKFLSYSFLKVKFKRLLYLLFCSLFQIIIYSIFLSNRGCYSLEFFNFDLLHDLSDADLLGFLYSLFVVELFLAKSERFRLAECWGFLVDLLFGIKSVQLVEINIVLIIRERWKQRLSSCHRFYKCFKNKNWFNI